jgi:ABC-type antimicrobial peptide transport system permease subunit
MTLEELRHMSTAEPRFIANLLGGFSLLALAITAVGTFGVVGYAIAARRRELAVRMALGARAERLSAMIVLAGIRPVLIGTGFGLVVAVVCTRFIRGLLFEIDPLAPSHYLVAGSVLLAVAALAAAAPLRRLFAIDAAESLRAE